MKKNTPEKALIETINAIPLPKSYRSDEFQTVGHILKPKLIKAIARGLLND